MRVFFDTNILVYLFDSDAGNKKEEACAFFKREAFAGRALLSTQVLQEFYVVVTRKLQKPLEPEVAESIIRDLSSLPVVTINSYDILSAIGRSRNMRLSFWDALIIESAIKGGATEIVTEDLQHGQIIDGLQIENPFVNDPSLS